MKVKEGPVTEHNISKKKRNKKVHVETGNRNTRGPSLMLAYLNKGPSFLKKTSKLTLQQQLPATNQISWELEKQTSNKDMISLKPDKRDTIYT